MTKYIESRCKICKSSFRDLYEKLRFVQKWKLKDIVDLAQEKLKEDFSIMSLSRHLKAHCKDIEQPQIEIPKEEILHDTKIDKLFMYLIFGMNKYDIEKLKEREEYTSPFYTNSLIYEYMHNMIKTLLPNYLDTFEAKWRAYIANPDITNQPLM